MTNIDELINKVYKIEVLVNDIHTCLVGDLKKGGMVDRLASVEKVIKRTTWIIGVVFVAFVGSLVKDFNNQTSETNKDFLIETEKTIDKLSN